MYLSILMWPLNVVSQLEKPSLLQGEMLTFPSGFVPTPFVEQLAVPHHWGLPVCLRSLPSLPWGCLLIAGPCARSPRLSTKFSCLAGRKALLSCLFYLPVIFVLGRAQYVGTWYLGKNCVQFMNEPGEERCLCDVVFLSKNILLLPVCVSQE